MSEGVTWLGVMETVNNAVVVWVSAHMSHPSGFQHRFGVFVMGEEATGMQDLRPF